MSLWRRHRFISLEEQDGQDRLEAGTQFIVMRVGSTCVSDTEIENSEQLMTGLYKDLLELFNCEHGCKLRLIVDLSGAVLCSKDGDVLQKFELSNIRDVIYSTKKEEHTRYFVLVGREESELTVKAHVLVCEDKWKAKLLYDTFIQVFTLAAEMRKCRRQESDNSALKNLIKKNRESALSFDDSIRYGCARVNTDVLHTHLPRCQTWTSSSMVRPRRRVEGNQYELNDCFTELARSRSSTGSTSEKLSNSDINSNGMHSNHSDVFM